MINNFETISNSEFETLKNSISWITILIAGADNSIDKEEREWAAKLTKIRSYASDVVLNDFYQQVGKNFQEQLDGLIDSLPEDVKSRTAILQDKLSMVNDILPKLDNKIAFKLYESYKSFAKHVASASGGFLRFMSISKEEKKLMTLDMINPIILDYDEEE